MLNQTSKYWLRTTIKVDYCRLYNNNNNVNNILFIIKNSLKSTYIFDLQLYYEL